MQLPTDIIPPMATWQEYTYVCDFDTCDTLIKVTVNDKFGWGPVKDIDCPACGRMPHLLSVEDATIYPKEKQGEKMETLAINEASYNPHELVTYKVIEDGLTSYKQVKVSDLEYQIHNSKQTIANLEKTLSNFSNQISSVMEIIDTAYADNDNAEYILEQLCEAIDHTPLKEVEFTATITITGRAEINIQDGDLESMLSTGLSIDCYDGNVIIEDYSVNDVEEN